MDANRFVAALRANDARMRSLAFKLLAGDAHRTDDVLQDAYTRAFDRLPQYRKESDFGGWLYRIVYNACIDELRRARQRPEPVAVLHAVGGRDPAVMVATADAVARALAALPVDQRAVVVLVDGEGFDNVAAAELLGVPPGTVGSRLSRARATLRTLLEENDG